MGRPDGSYDRLAAARILARVAGRLPAVDALPASLELDPELTPLTPAPGSHLTPAQLRYLPVPLQPHHVTSATHRILWRDSTGTSNVAHCTTDWALVPVVAREVVLLLRRGLGADVDERSNGLADWEHGVLAATTSDRDPVEILRVGFETTARALVQHAWLVGQTTYRTPTELARGLRDSGIFGVVANTWFWGLQSETFRRGMIPVSLTSRPDGGVAYTTESRILLRAMKDAAIAHPDPGDPGLVRQYGPLAYAEVPRCLANMPVTVAGERRTLLPVAVDLFVDTFVRLLDVVRITGSTDPQEEPRMSEVFEVPDMTCSHCTNTITGLLETHGATVSDIDLDSKQVVATFPSPESRTQAFDAIRDQGYTVVPQA
ncbi:heavy-metal-associated domain-containing protein [Kribbella sp. WER1]